MKPPFDISGDLDTPVSAFMKLAAFEPRFLLESVEGGERLARYKSPAHVAFSAESLPRNHLGKIDKIKLRALWPHLFGE